MKSFNFNYEEVRQQFLDFLLKLEIQPYDNSDIIFDGELHRYRIHDDKPYNKSGAFLVHTDGWPAGYVQDWRSGIKENWRYDASGLPDDQRKYFDSAEYRKKCEEQERKAEHERASKRAAKTELARQLWNRLKNAPETHPYLLRKHIKGYGLAYNPNTNCLAVPLRDIKGMLQSIQWIPAEEDKHKLFFEGAELKGAFFSLELDTINHPQTYDGVILIGEGYATMSKLNELTNLPIVAAMSCFRLEEITNIIHNSYPKAHIILAADNDHQTERKREHNPGLFHARSVAKKSSLKTSFTHSSNLTKTAQTGMTLLCFTATRKPLHCSFRLSIMPCYRLT